LIIFDCARWHDLCVDPVHLARDPRQSSSNLKEILMKRATRSIAVIALAAGIGACSGMTTQERNTALGAAAGGVIGNVITGGSTAGTVGGAAVGGVIGHEVSRDSSYDRHDRYNRY
jgi:osmotically inducible lipoprotein OsmB